jgi:hypothetical protein
MESLASNVSPANAETAAVANTDADAEVVATTGEGSDPSGTEAATPETPEKRDKVQERIDKLTREKYDALRERDQQGYELERLRQQVSQAQTAQVAPEEFPTLEKCGYDEAKYQVAVAKYFRDEARKAATEELTAAQQAERENTRQQSWAKKQAEFIKSKPDYAEKVLGARTLPISHEAQAALMESDLGPQVAYYLVENPEKAAAIMQLPLSAQLREIGRIEARLEAAKAPPKPPVSQAPPPPPKVEADASVDKDPSAMSDAEFAKWRRRQIAQRR